jgi:hypothetical protein
MAPIAETLAGTGWLLTACVGQPMRRRGSETDNGGPTRQVRATLTSHLTRKDPAKPHLWLSVQPFDFISRYQSRQETEYYRNAVQHVFLISG